MQYPRKGWMQNTMYTLFENLLKNWGPFDHVVFTTHKRFCWIFATREKITLSSQKEVLSFSLLMYLSAVLAWQMTLFGILQ
jgi:hypothetical protein